MPETTIFLLDNNVRVVFDAEELTAVSVLAQR